uniref:Uncharacterized protein n=1 Tax=Anopheles farauti TaxID=69004 RepID=A0A182QWK4_9DIPT
MVLAGTSGQPGGARFQCVRLQQDGFTAATHVRSVDDDLQQQPGIQPVHGEDRQLGGHVGEQGVCLLVGPTKQFCKQRRLGEVGVQRRLQHGAKNVCEFVSTSSDSDVWLTREQLYGISGFPAAIR